MKPVMIMAALLSILTTSARGQFSSDVIPTDAGDLEMHFIGHGTLMFTVGQQVIHIDPTMAEADYAVLPDADLILVTHQHGDHLDMTAINHILKEGTEVVMTRACMNQLEGFDARVMENGDKITLKGVGIEAIPAYNIVHTRPDGQPFHPKGEGNGYILSFGNTHVLIAGDTENIPELKSIRTPIAVAFLPMNLPYTMTPGMVADAASAFRPAILYPYHFGNTDTGELLELLKDEQGIEVRIRDLE